MKCPHPDCTEKFFKNNNKMSFHFQAAHGQKYVDWLCEKKLEEEHNGIWPLCRCSCGQRVPFYKFKFSEYCKGHHHKDKRFSLEAKRNMSIGTKKWRDSLTQEEKESIHDKASKTNRKNTSTRKKETEEKILLEKHSNVRPLCWCGKETKFNHKVNDFRKYCCVQHIKKTRTHTSVDNRRNNVNFVLGVLIENGFDENDLENILVVNKKKIISKLKRNEEVKLIRCKYCDEIIFDCARSIGSHNGYWHKEISEILYHQSKTELEKRYCEECKKKIEFRYHGFWEHVAEEHNMSVLDYRLKYEHNGIWPKCECGCGEEVKYRKKFSRFLDHHSSKGENNPMFGRTDELSPLYGVPKTEEQRRNMSISRSKGLANGTIKMNTGKRGNQCTIANPFFGNREEHFDSSWEACFFVWCTENNIRVDRSHSIYIPYRKLEKNKNSKEIEEKDSHYVPDFLTPDSNVFVEVKAYFANSIDYENFKRKTKALKEYCKVHASQYVVLFDQELREIGAFRANIRKKVANIYQKVMN